MKELALVSFWWVAAYAVTYLVQGSTEHAPVFLITVVLLKVIKLEQKP
jgi:hypothetical protein